QAFQDLPAGTLETLLKPENQGQLKTILYHHVTTSAYTIEMLKDGEQLGMVDGTRATVSLKEGQVWLDKARILGSVKAANGMVHVVDRVILPPSN
ncbi:MAG: fasciclin domain-containing protein, partial [Candidatus Cloacimonetes bacterium]|nr:fasciclin domain-containing protein [Candidatus Cloacimonadota bacterium]